MNKKIVRIFSCFIALTMLFSTSAFAHSGRTDSSGGHKDNKNKSGLGSYHYHCGGHPAHLHKGGICPYDPKDKISVNNMPSKMYVGDTVNLDYDVTAYSGSSWVDWESSDESVVKVSSSGVLTAVGSGNAKITATLYNGEKTYNITISNRAVEKVEVSAPKEEIFVGSVFYAEAQVAPNNATDTRIEWRSDNEDVAVIMEDGLVVIIGEGTAKLTATTLDGSGKKGSASIVSTLNDESEIDTEDIMSQLPSGYVFSVKPGSSAAMFALAYNLPYEYAMPEDLPLQIGSRGATVKDIQTVLIASGHLNDKADGIFGKNTDAGVASFCEANNYPYTGTVDFECYVAIMESNMTLCIE